MARKKVKEEIRKPDIVMVAFERASNWIKANTRTCIIVCAVAILIGLSGWGYGMYQSSKDEKAQYRLAEGISNFQQYTMAKQDDALRKSEDAFKGVLKESNRGPGEIARLYLGKIAVLKGRNEEAKAFYGEVTRNASNDVVKKLAETALQELDKKK